MKIKIFQFLRYTLRAFYSNKVVSGLSGIDLRPRAARMIFELNLACRFGGARLIILGDSNGATLDNRKSMTQFGCIALNLSVPGTTAGDWDEFFTTREGIEVLRLINEICEIVLWNIGGNSVLQGKMHGADKKLNFLHTYFPKSWIMNIPPVKYDWFEAFGGNPDRLKNDTATINQYIFQYWKNNVIDLYSAFLPIYEHQRELFNFIESDFVHFSKIADRKIRIPLIKEKLKL